jgi:hypothetical protein
MCVRNSHGTPNIIRPLQCLKMTLTSLNDVIKTRLLYATNTKSLLWDKIAHFLSSSKLNRKFFWFKRHFLWEFLIFLTIITPSWQCSQPSSEYKNSGDLNTGQNANCRAGHSAEVDIFKSQLRIDTEVTEPNRTGWLWNSMRIQ